tara:strand:- start:441 stop:872 length:432 start_codon:yes stop_codon:yes gene_type:complete
MSLVRLQTEMTYRSSSTYGEEYYFTVVQNISGTYSVRDIRTPNGRLVDALGEIPKSVTDDITTAIAELENLMAGSSAVNGTLDFEAETSKAVEFDTEMATDTYRVTTSTNDFIVTRITNKTTTGFTVELSASYTGSVGFDVFV